MAEQLVIRDLRPGMKSVTCIFIVIDKGWSCTHSPQPLGPSFCQTQYGSDNTACVCVCGGGGGGWVGGWGGMVT